MINLSYKFQRTQKYHKIYIRFMINRYTNRTWHVCHPFIWSFPVDPCHLFYACNETFSSGAVTSCFSELDWGNVLTDCTTAAPCYGVKFKFFLGYHFNFYNDILVPYMKCLVHTGYLSRALVFRYFSSLTCLWKISPIFFLHKNLACTAPLVMERKMFI